MDREELQGLLDRLGIKEQAYTLSGGHWEGRYTLDHFRDKWSVYYVDRGVKMEEQVFDSEDAACRELLRQVLEDPDTRERPTRAS